VADALGSHYFTNSGSLAAVFDCDQPHEADFGPTITSAILFRRDAEGRYSQSLDFSRGSSYPSSAPPREGMRVSGEVSGATALLAHDPLLDWGAWVDGTAVGCFVVTDTSGDFCEGERLIIGGGAARARALSAVRTHRHWFMAQDGGHPPDLEPLVGVFRSPLWGRRNRFLEVQARQTSSVPPPGRQLRVHALADAMSGVPTSDLLEAEVRDLLPRWLVRALDDGRQEFVSQAAAAFLPILGRLLDELSVTLADQASGDILRRLNAEVIGGPRKEVLVRGMLRQALQVLAGSEVNLANKAAEVFTSGLPLSPEQLLRAAGSVALWALAYGSVDRHTALLLTMGRDPYRGRLEYTPSPARGVSTIRAHLPVVLERPSALFQERVLRAIARDGWSGELRTSPAWVPLQTHLTVHSQGGCPMGTDPAFSVTDPWGQVHDCPGLYVMDAAAFPTSIGVNPSATITAVAELKIEHFIRHHGHSGWQARDMTDAVAWADQRRDAIDPLRQLKVFSHEPPVERLGLHFKEQMHGFASPAGGTRADWTRLEADPAAQEWEQFRVAEEEAMRQGHMVFGRLRLRTTDLAELVASASTTHPVTMTVTGRIDLRNRRTRTLQRLRTSDSGGSYVQFFAAPPAAPGVKGPGGATQARYFRYELELTDGRRRYHLHGRKVLHNDRGTDVWSDTATLYFELVGPGMCDYGILRLSLAEFARRQLPSMTITGTTDPARRTWALLAFYKYFASGLSEVYAARADRLVTLLLKSVTTIHV
jgi:hypothetical protein